jgi:hypothetical protein
LGHSFSFSPSASLNITAWVGALMGIGYGALAQTEQDVRERRIRMAATARGAQLGPRRRALLMPGSISAGHQTAAIACASTLEALGWSTRTLDATWLVGRNTGPAARTTVRAMLAIPGL